MYSEKNEHAQKSVRGMQVLCAWGSRARFPPNHSGSQWWLPIFLPGICCRVLDRLPAAKVFRQCCYGYYFILFLEPRCQFIRAALEAQTKGKADFWLQGLSGINGRLKTFLYGVGTRGSHIFSTEAAANTLRRTLSLFNGFHAHKNKSEIKGSFFSTRSKPYMHCTLFPHTTASIWG